MKGRTCLSEMCTGMAVCCSEGVLHKRLNNYGKLQEEICRVCRKKHCM